ncbi:MAG: MBL fold metallo-hydrolase [Lachnospiraceae bacterium]|nr:MBL fold metallo-hydrolase [Lachnospiraceae bacterium]
MRLLSIASGSSGNCIYVGYEGTNLLIDAGISGKRIEAGLNMIGLKTSDIDGILITHEHADHIAGLKVVSNKYKVPVYATGGTINEILNGKKKIDIDPGLFREVKADQEFTVKDMLINPIRISHDAAEPVCYRFYGNDSDSAAVCTDLGTYDDYILDNLEGVSALLLEANHDIKMLEAGPYPYFLKKRILGEKGHLSNDSAGELLTHLMASGKLKTVLLGHLSKENNYAALAFETVRMQLEMLGYGCASSKGYMDNTKVNLGVALRDEPGKLINI